LHRPSATAYSAAQIQTRPGAKASDGADYTPQRALHESINDLQTELQTIRRAFSSEVDRVGGGAY